MTVFIALLRAVNVGGTGALPMKELAALCAGLGFGAVRTYIQSGNVVFESTHPEEAVRTMLEGALSARMGKDVAVLVRSAAELEAVLRANPFPALPPAKVAIVFLGAPVARDALEGLAAPGGEEVRPGKREIYIYYPEGMGRSKLKLPRAVGITTARNLNTVAKLVALSAR